MGNVRSAAVAALEALASTQLGLFTLEQARHIGVPSQTIAYQANPGRRWRRVLPSVYELTRLPPDPDRVMLAALLWAGPEAVLSHRAAGLIEGLDGIREGQPEILTIDTKVTKGVVVHRGEVAKSDITTTGQLRHTKVVRTVLDLSSVLDDDTLELVVESALRRNRRWERQFLEAAESGHRGCRALQRVLARRGPGTPPTESELETRYIQVLRTVDVPPPVRQHCVVDENNQFLGRLDLCWPEAHLWVELDGSAWHDRPEALFRDRRRQNNVVAELEWLPLRFTWPDVLGRPGATAAQSEAAYRRRAASVGARSAAATGLLRVLPPVKCP
jgi:hypothetical protein